MVKISESERLIIQINEFLNEKISEKELKKYVDNFSFNQMDKIIFYLINEIKIEKAKTISGITKSEIKQFRMSKENLSEKNKINALLLIIKHVEKLYGMAEKWVIQDKMYQKHKITVDETNELLERLRRDGELYEPKANYFKIV